MAPRSPALGLLGLHQSRAFAAVQRPALPDRAPAVGDAHADERLIAFITAGIVGGLRRG